MQGSCTAWSVAYALKSHQEELKRGWGVKNSAHQFSPSFVYNQLCGGVDNGIYISSAMSLIVSMGVCSLASFPYNDYDFTTQPTSPQRIEALEYKAISWNTIVGGDAIKTRLAEGDGVVIGISVYPDFSLNNSNPIYDIKYGPLIGYHAICLVGYDDSLQAYKFMNSWGSTYGNGGYGWISYDMLYDPDISIYGVAVGYVMNMQPVSPPITLALNIPEDIAITPGGGRREVQFTAPAAGMYFFESSNRNTLDPKAYVAATGSAFLDDDSVDGWNYRFQQTLATGQTFTFFSGVYGDLIVNGSYKVTV